MKNFTPKASLLSSLFIFCTLNVQAAAVSITGDLLNADGNRWQVDYTITNESLGSPVEEVEFLFSADLFDSLDFISGPADWDSIVLQPDPIIGADGIFDIYTFGAGINSGESLSGVIFEFDWLGAGSPTGHEFNILDPFDFSVIDSGNVSLTSAPVSPVPLPGSGLLFLSALVGISLFKVRRTTKS